MITKRYLVLRTEREFTSCSKYAAEDVVTNVEIVGIYKTKDTADNVASKLGNFRNFEVQEIDWED